LRKTILTALKLLFFLSLGFFFIWLFVKNLSPQQIDEILDSVKHANYSWLLLSMIIGIFSHLMRTLRWKMLLKPMGYYPKTSNVLMSVFIGYLANLALPRLGEISRCAALAKYEKIPLQKGFGTVVTERTLDFITLVVLFSITIIIHFQKIGLYFTEKVVEPIQEKILALPNPNLVFYIIGGVLLLLVGFLIYFRQHLERFKIYVKLRDIIKGFWEGFASLAKMKKPWLFVFYTVLIWLSYWIMTHVMFMSLTETKHLGLNASLIVLMFGSIGMIVVQGGIGIYPAIVAETMFLFNISATTGYALGWLLWFAQTFMLIFIGVLSLGLMPVLNKAENVVETMN
jgi:hypothetical protein